MVGASGEDDAREAPLFDLPEDPLRFRGEVFFVFLHFFPRGFCGVHDVAVGDVHLLQFLREARDEGVFIVERQERMEEGNARPVEQGIHVPGDRLRIGGDHGAHIGVFIAFIRAVVDAGVPDEIGLSADQVEDVGVYQLDGVAFRIGRDGLQRAHGDLPDVRASYMLSTRGIPTEPRPAFPGESGR